MVVVVVREEEILEQIELEKRIKRRKIRGENEIRRRTKRKERRKREEKDVLIAYNAIIKRFACRREMNVRSLYTGLSLRLAPHRSNRRVQGW